MLLMEGLAGHLSALCFISFVVAKLSFVLRQKEAQQRGLFLISFSFSFTTSIAMRISHFNDLMDYQDLYE